MGDDDARLGEAAVNAPAVGEPAVGEPVVGEPLRRDPVTGLLIPPPVVMNARRIVASGTVVFFVAFLALLPFYGRLGDHGHRLWLWTCLAGTILGILGWSIMNRHRGLGRTI